MTLVKLSSKGQLVIPSAIRHAAGLASGDKLDIRLVDGEVHIEVVRKTKIKKAASSTRAPRTQVTQAKARPAQAAAQHTATVQESMDILLTINGAMCACLVDTRSGMVLGQAGGGVDLEVAAAGNTELVRAKLKTMHDLEMDDDIEDILITLGAQYHIIRPMAQFENLFLYVVLDKLKANLAMARRKVQEVEQILRT